MEPPFFREKEREHQINNSQGIIAYVTQSAPVGFNQLLEKAKGSTCKIIVALDQIQDPHNLGAIFRVCDAVGVAGLFYTADRSTGLTSVARKVSAGASEFLAYSEVKNLARSLEQARKEGYLIYGTSLEESSQSLYEAVYSEPMVIVFGSEGEGLRKQTKELCDVLISIPMAGTVQSLNVSTSASAVLFEIKRKLSIEN
jgi:23S rRNA (guanosine2251-2'-O)-methyltransferase